MFIPIWLVILILMVFTACSNKSGNVVQNTAPQATSIEPPWYYASAIQVGGEGSTIVSKTVDTNSQVQAMEWALTVTGNCAGDGGSPTLIQNGIDFKALM